MIERWCLAFLVAFTGSIHICIGVEAANLKLIGGSNRYEGNVFYKGKPVCDDLSETYGNKNGEVVCRELGFSGLERFTEKSHFGSVPAVFSMDNVKCTGNESRLEDCPHITNEDCGAGEGVGVVCLDCPLTDIDFNENDIKSIPNIPNWETCARECSNEGGCSHWTWTTPDLDDKPNRLKCYLKNSGSGRTNLNGVRSGTSSCQLLKPVLDAPTSATAEEEVLLNCTDRDFPHAEVSFDVINQHGDEVAFHKLGTNSISVEINDLDTHINVTCTGSGKGKANGRDRKSIDIDHEDCFFRDQASDTGFDHIRKQAETPKLCQKLCAKTETCIGFDWTANDNACLLLERTKNATRSKGWITGPKHCENKESRAPWIWIAVLVGSITSAVSLIILIIICKRRCVNSNSPPPKKLLKSEKSKTKETTCDMEDDGEYESVRKNSKKGKKMKNLKKSNQADKVKKRSDLANRVEENCYMTIIDKTSDENLYDDTT